jgi:GNAT superfamily N-acetyltransferase
MSAPEPVTLALLERWLTGWCRSRGLPLPRHAGDGLVIDVGWPDQLRRHVFQDAGAALRRCAAGIHPPFVHLKVAVDRDILRQTLPPGWTIEAPGYLMRRCGPMTPAGALASGYDVDLSVEHGAYVIRIVSVADATGAIAASGRITLRAGTAVFDQIETAEPHRRKGLASAVMLALDQLACQADVTERLLVATEAGVALYVSLGWEHVAPWSTAVLR